MLTAHNLLETRRRLAKEIAGLDFAKAEQHAKTLGFQIRILKLDGHIRPFNNDVNPWRLDVEVKRGTISGQFILQQPTPHRGRPRKVA